MFLLHYLVYMLRSKNKKKVILLKKKLNLYDKLFYYYSIQIKLPIFSHKAFIAIEIQLNAVLIRGKLVPYSFIVYNLCFYNLVQVNNTIINNPYYIIDLFDNIRLPLFLYNCFNYQYYEVNYLPRSLKFFLKKYWNTIFHFTQNRIWLLTTHINSQICGKVIFFDYPHISAYIAPFQ